MGDAICRHHREKRKQEGRCRGLVPQAEAREGVTAGHFANLVIKRAVQRGIFSRVRVVELDIQHETHFLNKMARQHVGTTEDLLASRRFNLSILSRVILVLTVGNEKFPKRAVETSRVCAAILGDVSDGGTSHRAVAIWLKHSPGRELGDRRPQFQIPPKANPA
jgi:hypothetical protein